MGWRNCSDEFEGRMGLEGGDVFLRILNEGTEEWNKVTVR